MNKRKSTQTKPVVERTVSHFLQRKLTDTELLEAGDKLAKAQGEIEGLDSELSIFKSDIKAKKTELMAIVEECGLAIRVKVRNEGCLCMETLDYETERFTLVRYDTGEVVEDRRMTAAELSRLPMDDGGASEASPPPMLEQGASAEAHFIEDGEVKQGGAQ